MANNVIIGVNILEILTTGMYRDSRVIFREYIQNACDQINAAVKTGLFSSADEGEVKLWIDDRAHSVSIEDNATGIPQLEFEQTLYSIGESGKTLGEEMGFRGIGHWCGLGYCKWLVFTSKAAGEQVECIMTCNAEQMRKMMEEHNTHKAFYCVNDVLSATVAFSKRDVIDSNSHYFKVELIDIPDLYDELYNEHEIKEYLAFVAPVEYDIPWRFERQIHLHAQGIGQTIQEYKVFVNEGAIRKKYKPSFTTSKGEDTITEIDFKDFRNDQGNLIAWLWFGISRFQGVIKQENPMRGIRLRMQNIQIGSDDALQKLFKEDRGQHYFVGEVFAVTRELIPNSQRDYFNPGEARVQFERILSDFFNDDLSRIYKAGSQINSKFDKIQKVERIEAELASAGTVTNEHRERLERARKEAETAAKELEKIRAKTSSSLQEGTFGTYDVVVDEILKRNEETRASHPKPLATDVSTSSTPKRAAHSASNDIKKNQPKTQVPSDRMIPLSVIIRIIRESIDASVAEKIMAKIEEEIL